MKQFLLAVLIYLIGINVSMAQEKTKDRLNNNKQAVVVDKTDISIDESGIPIYLYVLRLNNEVVDIMPVPYFDRGTGVPQVYDLTIAVKFVVPIRLFSGDQIDELTTKYKAVAAGGYLNIIVSKDSKNNLSPPYTSTSLPAYLKFSIERLKLK